MIDQKELKRFALKTISDALKKNTDTEIIDVRVFKEHIVLEVKEWFDCRLELEIYNIKETNE